MGGATWSSADYSTRSATYTNQSRAEVFKQRRMRSDFDPLNIKVRESCDSEQNPNSTPVIVGLDVTGSMGFIAEHIAKESLGKLVEGIIDTKPITDPHIMMMAIGDIQYDSAPLQATQFEADIRIADQLTDLWLEGGGGGNRYESYDLPWLFAAEKTKIDSYDKRGVKGYLFTIGDELPPTTARSSTLRDRVGVSFQQDLSTKEALELAQEKWNVFHIIVEEGSFCRRAKDAVQREWNELLGKRAVNLNDYRYISEVIQSVMQVSEGENPEDVIEQWQEPKCRDAVEYALFGPHQQ